MSLRNKIKKIAKRFCRQTTIHGLPYIGRGVMRFPWTFIFTLMLALCTWQSTINVLDYLSFHVQTSITWDVVQEIEFPVVTFCPQYSIKASGFDNKMRLLAAYFLSKVYAKDDKSLNDFQNSFMKSCINKEINEANVPPFDFGNTDNMLKGSYVFNKRYAVGFEDILLKCIWKGQPFDCPHAFINLVGEKGVCFSFNVGEELRQQFEKTKQGSGMNFSAYSESKYKITSPNTGLSLLMKIDQADHCGNFAIIKEGDGILVKAHGKNYIANHYFDTFTAMSPGYETVISLQKKQNVRRTEHLGRCVNNYKLNFLQNETVGIASLCLLNCGLEKAFTACHCIPNHFGSLVELSSVKTWKNYLIRVCNSWDDMKCMKRMDDFVSSELTYKSCNCRPACFEDYFTAQVSTRLLTKARLRHGFNLDNVTETKVRKNHLVVDINFLNMVIETIEETQQFSFQDMLIYIGGNMGLFLGMSFMSPFEPIFLIVSIVGAIGTFYKICTWRRKHKFRRVRPMIERSKVDNRLMQRRNAITEDNWNEERVISDRKKVKKDVAQTNTTIQQTSGTVVIELIDDHNTSSNPCCSKYIEEHETQF